MREVAPGSVAEKAGVKPGDRILSFGGREVADAAALPAVLRTATAGSKVKVRVLRDGAEVELEAAFP
ncbi:Periplasmic pH-dependent serine endoprotease DegQ precursor [compost metagenome]